MKITWIIDTRPARLAVLKFKLRLAALERAASPRPPARLPR